MSDKCCPICGSVAFVERYHYIGDHALKMGLTAVPFALVCKACNHEGLPETFDCPDNLPFDPEPAGKRKLMLWQPTATRIEPEVGGCPNCRSDNFFSYQLPDDLTAPKRTIDRIDHEICGFYCASCDWGNGGSRPA